MAEKIFTVDKFLGINEFADSATELTLGEASVMENFNISDDYNLRTRAGVKNFYRAPSGNQIRAVWDGMLGAYHFLLMVYSQGSSVSIETASRNDAARALQLDGKKVLPVSTDGALIFFQHGNKLYLSGKHKQFDLPFFVSFYYDGSDTLMHYELQKPVYVPLYLSGMNPTSGEGDEIEPLNLLPSLYQFENGTSAALWQARLQYSSDGSTKAYKLPKDIKYVLSATVDNSAASGTFNATDNTYTFTTAPAKGVNNVEFYVGFVRDDLKEAAETFNAMRYTEAYNGATDTRTFFYGNGTNLSYYTGAPANGEGLYIPIGNELSVDSSASMLTGMRRQGSRLMAFKPDGAFSIDYTTVTLDDGRLIAGFYVYPVHRGIGNDMDNQVQTVGNFARTLCAGSLYEWRYSASYHQDERYAKIVSQKVAKTLAGADVTKIVTCDDNATQTYYMFLNDDRGTVLVNRYGIDVWTIYTGEVFKNVRFALASQKDVLLVTDTAVYTFDASFAFDDPVEANGEMQRIGCQWESGYMSFGADYLQKHSSNLWVSMLPENRSRMEITVKTDKRDEYVEKAVGQSLLDFSDISFKNFSFLRSNAPKIKKVKIKVKKFVYYKLIFRVAIDESTAGDRATVLGYDQQIRYSSAVK